MHAMHYAKRKQQLYAISRTLVNARCRLSHLPRLSLWREPKTFSGYLCCVNAKIYGNINMGHTIANEMKWKEKSHNEIEITPHTEKKMSTKGTKRTTIVNYSWNMYQYIAQLLMAVCICVFFLIEFNVGVPLDCSLSHSLSSSSNALIYWTQC